MSQAKLAQTLAHIHEFKLTSAVVAIDERRSSHFSLPTGELLCAQQNRSARIQDHLPKLQGTGKSPGSHTTLHRTMHKAADITPLTCPASTWDCTVSHAERGGGARNHRHTGSSSSLHPQDGKIAQSGVQVFW